MTVRDVDDVRITLTTSGTLELALCNVSYTDILVLTGEDAGRLAGMLIVAAGAAGADATAPFTATLEVIRHGFDEFLAGAAQQALDAADKTTDGLKFLDTLRIGVGAQVEPDGPPAVYPIEVTCPKCGSSPDDRCTFPSGRYLPAARPFHLERLNEARDRTG